MEQLSSARQAIDSRHHDRRTAYVLAPDSARRDDAPVPVLVALLARDGARADAPGERAGGLVAAGPSPLHGAAPLHALRDVDAMQTHPRTAHLQRVAVDNSRRSRDRRTGHSLRERIAHRAHAAPEPVRGALRSRG